MMGDAGSGSGKCLFYGFGFIASCLGALLYGTGIV